jgi:sensor histidine kinase YesM
MNIQEKPSALSFAIFNPTVWICFYGLVRILQTAIFSKPAIYLIVDISDTFLGFILCFGAKFLLQNQIAKASLKTILTVVATSLCLSVVWLVIHNQLYLWVFPHNTAAPFSIKSLKGLIMPFYVFVVWCAAYAFWQYSLWRQQEKEKLVLTELENQKFQMRALQNQLTPHFLFNALNSIYSNAIKEGAAQTQTSILALSDLLRHASKQSDNGLCSLNEEIMFIQNYLRIEGNRFSNRLMIECLFPEVLPNAYVPKMLIQPLIESVIRHVVQESNQPTKLSVTIKIENRRLEARVINTLPADLDSDKKNGLGTGINNLRQRLRLHYADAALFSVKKDNQNFCVLVNIPL